MKHRNELTKTESRRLCLTLLHLIIAAGIIAGAFAVRLFSSKNPAELWWLHQFFPPIFSGNTVLAVCRNTFLSSLIILAAVFFFGFSSAGQPLSLAALFYRGIGIGFSTAYMYSVSGAGALPSVLILLFPKALALSFTAALAVRESLKLSAALFSFLLTDEPPETGMKKNLKLYFVKFLVLTVLTFFIAAADSLLNYFFMNLQ